jgi:hypothetical protein
MVFDVPVVAKCMANVDKEQRQPVAGAGLSRDGTGPPRDRQLDRNDEV